MSSEPDGRSGPAEGCKGPGPKSPRHIRGWLAYCLLREEDGTLARRMSRRIREVQQPGRAERSSAGNVSAVLMARVNGQDRPAGDGLVLDIHADFLEWLATRVVVPSVLVECMPLPAKLLDAVYTRLVES